MAVAGKRVYVTDSGNDRVCVFEADKLRFLFSFGQKGGGLGQFRSPRGIAAHGSKLYVADQLNHRIQVFSLDHVADSRCPPVGAIGGGASATPGRFSAPSGVCVANNRLYVAEVGGERLQVLTLDGLPLQSITSMGPSSSLHIRSRPYSFLV